MRPRSLTFLTLALALLFASPAVTHAATPLYPNLRTLPPRLLRFDRTDVSVDGSGDLHNVLRFSNTVYNTGEGPLEIWARIDPTLNPPAGQAYQRIYDDQGGHVDVTLPGSTLYYHAIHQHYHFDHWGEYQLWTRAAYDAWIASGETTGQPDVVGAKTTSCVEDEEFVTSVAASVWPPAYPPANCLPDANHIIREGLSVGWGDTYDYYRYQQWIDLGQSTLANGTYVLRSVTDPDNLVYESTNKADGSRENQDDNSAITVFTVSNGQIADGDPPTGTVTINNVDRTTSTGAVNLSILGRDDVSGVRVFRVSNDGTTWKQYANTSYDSIPQNLSWDLTDPSTGGSNRTGIRTVSVVFQDNSGKWGPTATDTIDYEPAPPPPPPTSAYGRTVAADHPVGWWRLGDASGTTAADQEGLNNGTYRGGFTLLQPSLLPGDANAAAGFNGSTSFVVIPPAVAFNFTNSFSLEAWIKPTSLPASGSFRTIVTKPESYSLQFNGPRLEFTVIQNQTRRRLQAPSGAIVAGSTYHVVGTYDGTTQRLYVNGALVASAALAGGATVTTNSVFVGSWDGTAEYFAGTIDEPAVYGTVLSATQVRAHYDAASAATLAAPSNLSAAARSTTQVDLGWLDNSTGETGQVVERAADSSFTSPTDVSVSANQQSYSDTGLTAGTTYWYRVKAVAGGASSAWSTPVPVSTPATASYAATVIGDRPVSYWKLNETSGTVVGDATVANPGAYEGSPSLGLPSLVATDSTGTAVGFNGVSSDARIGEAGSLDLSTGITLEAFIQPTSLPAAGSFRSIVAKTGSYALDLNGPTVELTIVQLGVSRRLQAPAGTIAAGGSYYVVGTYDGTTERLYVNGVQVASAALSGAADATINGVRIGSWDGAQQFFAGTIDDVSVYAKALSGAQVATHFNAAQLPLGAPSGLTATPVSTSQVNLAWADNAGAETGQVLQRSTDAAFTAPTTIALGANVQSYADSGLVAGTQYWYRVRAIDLDNGSAWSPVATATTQAAPPPASYASVVAADAPVGWWRLGEASGTTAANQAGGGSGTYVGGVTLGQTSLLATDAANKAVAFNGSSGRVTVPNAAALQVTNHFSLEAWIKPTSLPASGAFRTVMTKAESYSLQFNGPRMEFTVIQSGTRRRLQAPSGAIVAGGTYHVVGTFDGTTQRLYVNGVQVASAALSGSASVTTNSLIVGSWDGGSEFFAGTIDEPAVYNAVLSSAQVAAHYRTGTTG